MSITLIKSVFHFQYRYKDYTVEFSDINKKWYVNHKSYQRPVELPWNGIKSYPTADDAETILLEHLGIDE